MRPWLAIALLACGEPSPAPTPAPSVVAQPPAPSVAALADPLAYCDLVRTVLDRLAACDPDDAQLATVRSLPMFGDRDEIAKLADPIVRGDISRKSGALCAHVIEGFAAQPIAAKCKLATFGRLAEVDAYLDTYYADRIQLTPDEAADPHLAALARIRDEACTCKDEPCARQARTRFDEAIQRPSSNRSPALARTAGRLVDDLSKCTSDARFASGR